MLLVVAAISFIVSFIASFIALVISPESYAGVASDFVYKKV